jgi:Fur family transcriptional regulator, iron response regulator
MGKARKAKHEKRRLGASVSATNCGSAEALRSPPQSRYRRLMKEVLDLEGRLRSAGLRPTQQRLSLARLLFGSGDRHVSAEALHDEAAAARISVSLATVYNTLNQFKAAGLLREIAIEGERSYFDTNTSNHFHFFNEERKELMDIEADGVTVGGIPELPSGKVIDRIDVIVRLKDA